MNNYNRITLELLECNIDDMNPEQFPYAISKLLAAGAKDAWITPAIMKHGRPANILHALCEESFVEKLMDIFFEETTTIGLRRQTVARYELLRETVEVNTKYGLIKVKLGKNLQGKLLNFAPEYKSCEELANKLNLPLKNIYQEACQEAFRLLK